MKEAMMFIVRYPLAWVVVKKLVLIGDFFGAEQVASEYLDRSLTRTELRVIHFVCLRHGDLTGAGATTLRIVEHVCGETSRLLRVAQRMHIVW